MFSALWVRSLLSSLQRRLFFREKASGNPMEQNRTYFPSVSETLKTWSHISYLEGPLTCSPFIHSPIQAGELNPPPKHSQLHPLTHNAVHHLNTECDALGQTEPPLGVWGLENGEEKMWFQLVGRGDTVNLGWIRTGPTKAMGTTNILEEQTPQVHTAKQL